jgi:hypothetical protein
MRGLRIVVLMAAASWPAGTAWGCDATGREWATGIAIETRGHSGLRARARHAVRAGSERARGAHGSRPVIIKRPDHPFTTELPDEWLAAAGVTGVAAPRSAYRAAAPDNPSPPSMLLPLTCIWLQARADSVPDFRRERMMRVLDGIRLDQALPPFEVEAEVSGQVSHRLYNGRHDFPRRLR